MRDAGRVADEKGDGDRLAQGPPEGQGGGGQDPRVGARHHHFADHLPRGGAQRHGRLAVGVAHAGQGGPGERHHGGDDHDGEHESGQEQAGALGEALEEQLDRRDLLHEGLDVAEEDGLQDVEAPEPDHDAGHGGDQVDADPERGGDPTGAHFGQERRRGQAHRDGDEHGDRRHDERAEDERSGAVLVGDRVPGGRPQEAQAEVAEGLARLADDALDRWPPGRPRTTWRRPTRATGSPGCAAGSYAVARGVGGGSPP